MIVQREFEVRHTTDTVCKYTRVDITQEKAFQFNSMEQLIS